ncbi:MAG: hypothetical protein ACE5DI_04350 [Candidatus Micrarchaeia archaeon]
MAFLNNSELLRNYLLFCDYRNKAKTTSKINLAATNWLYPTTLLPLGNFIRENKAVYEYVQSSNTDVDTCISIMLDENYSESFASKESCLMVRLPVEKEKCELALQHLYELHDNGQRLGGQTAFKYIIEELVDNIYEHSEFRSAFVMAQAYPEKRFAEMCFFDNGISFQGAYEKRGKMYSGFESIRKALEGVSVKPELQRGFGLRTTLKLVAEGLGGQALIVSGTGGFYKEKDNQKQTGYTFQAERQLKGTLISMRIPFSTKPVDIYKFVE